MRIIIAFFILTSTAYAECSPEQYCDYHTGQCTTTLVCR